MDPEIKVTPNPFTDGFSVTVTNPFNTTVILSVADADGRIIRVAGWEIEAGDNRMPFTGMGALSPGHYTLAIQFSDSRFNQSIAIVKD